MIFQGKGIQLQQLPDGLVELVFDRQGEAINKFDVQTMSELAEVAALLSARPDTQGLLISSAKDCFIVGADITQFSQLFREPEDLLAAQALEINRAFSGIEDLPFPSVCAINGIAVGGGMEMALCADYRVAAETATLGLPEVKLGINPGFGGTVRLPRVIGVDNAVEWICMGKEYKAKDALKAGAVDAVVALDKLRQAALNMLLSCVEGRLPWCSRRDEKLNPVQLNDVERTMAFTTAKAVVGAAAGPHMKAPMAAVKLMEKSATLARDPAIALESANFAALAKTDAAAALVGLFLNEQGASRNARELSQHANPLHQSAVLGAGIMGGGIAYQSAYKGTPVLMKDIQASGLAAGMAEASKLLAGQVERGKMTASRMGQVLSSIRPTLDYTGFDSVDVVVEAVVENARIKQAVLAEVETHLRPDAIISSNTSTISITQLASALQRPENFCGMHFFNPVHKMPLVEVIRGAKSSETAVATVVEYARRMGKTPIVVNDCPGFYVNRVLFPYFAGFELLLAEGADFNHVDGVMERFGWPMGPAYLLDVVGLDTAHHAAEVMAEGFPDRMKASTKGAVQTLYEAGRLGQKNGVGFYRYTQDAKGKPRKEIDAETSVVLGKIPVSAGNFSDEAIIHRLMLPMCIEAVRCLEEGVVSCAGDADLGLIMGLGFPVFRGGPLRYIDSLGLPAFCALCDQYISLGKLYEPTDGLRQMAASGQRFFN